MSQICSIGCRWLILLEKGFWGQPHLSKEGYIFTLHVSLVAYLLLEYLKLFFSAGWLNRNLIGCTPIFNFRFQNPIENGQRADSTTKDVKIMKHRAHVLHKQLQGFVQRKTMSVLKDELPSKCVYVISVRLSPLQRALYLKFLETYGLQNGTLVKQSGRSFLFEAYHTLAKVR